MKLSGRTDSLMVAYNHGQQLAFLVVGSDRILLRQFGSMMPREQLTKEGPNYHL
ncbi:MAG: hypothetical protein IPL69_03595 [Saprospiraceae bacterium]|nr:hypothetical protein [Candidatus Brachybacter algidus]